MDRVTAANVFVTIVERGSMAAAATALDMSRSMVTRYLSEMEGWAGVRLLHRSTRRLSLTAAGERVLHLCRHLQEIETDVSAVHQQSDAAIQGLLRISCSQFMAQDVLVPFIRDYLRQYPLVSIDLHVSNHAVNLVEERIDLAIRITNDLDPNLIARPLGRIASTVCASSEYLNQNGIPTEVFQLSQHNCLTYSYFGKSIWEFTLEGEAVSAAVSGSFSANESVVLLKAALCGAGIALQPRYAVAPFIGNGGLTEILPDFVPKTLGIYGIYRSRKHMSAALRILLNDLKKYLAQIQL